MKVDKIPLAVRLERIENGYASDPKYNYSALKSWAKIPVCNYMAAFPEEKEQLGELLYLSVEELEELTYCGAARKVNESFFTAGPRRRHNAIEAMKLLALPFERYFEERSKQLKWLK